jgi:hypothetical protein
VLFKTNRGRVLFYCGGCSALLKYLKLQILFIKSNETIYAKVYCQEGNSPYFKLRSLNFDKCLKFITD